MSLGRSERFWLKVNKTDSCWLWLAGVDGKGYGKFWDGSRQVRALDMRIRIKSAPSQNS